MTTCDFFIVGAPKAATTSMAFYLQQHPNIFIPEIKEPSFFGSDLTGHRIATSIDEYFDLFRNGHRKLCGEGSTWYLYSTRAAQEIYQFNPRAKIIIMLRNPVDLMYSLHSQNLYNGHTEDIQDFAEALAAEPERKRGHRIPSSCDRVEALFYTEVIRFYDQVKRYYDVFGRDRVHVIIYRDFKQNNLAEYRKTLEFLEVDSSFTPTFAVQNENKRLRSRMLHQFLSNTPEFIRWIGRFTPPRARLGMRNVLGNVNTSHAPRPPMDPLLRRRLQRSIVDEVDRLGQLLQRDMKWWCEPEMESTIQKNPPGAGLQSIMH